MRVFLDTNVVLENLCDRRLAPDAQAVFEAIDRGDIDGYINSGSFSNITYIAELQLKKSGMGKADWIATLRLILHEMLDRLTIVPQGNSDLCAGVDDASFTDLEDSYQYQAFKQAGCDYFVTINTHDFPCAADARILHLSDFVKRFL